MIGPFLFSRSMKTNFPNPNIVVVWNIINLLRFRVEQRIFKFKNDIFGYLFTFCMSIRFWNKLKSEVESTYFNYKINTIFIEFSQSCLVMNFEFWVTVKQFKRVMKIKHRHFFVYILCRDINHEYLFSR